MSQFRSLISRVGLLVMTSLMIFSSTYANVTYPVGHPGGEIDG
jgi:hypothetical protein